MAVKRDARVTVCFTVDFDAVSIWHFWGAKGARSRSRGDFERLAVPRILDLLDRHEVKSTWYVPGHTAETYPALAAEAAARGHEIGNHGYVHEDFSQLSPDQLHDVIRRSNDAVERVTGQRPRGIRIPVGDFDESIFELLIDEGFTYDTSLVSGPENEYEPYWCRGRGVVRDDGPNVEGPQLPLVEVPLNFFMSDFLYFEFNYGAPLLTGQSEPDKVFRVWKSEFEYVWERNPGGVFHLVVHPQAIGHGGRMRDTLERFFEECGSRDGVRFVTVEQLADEFRASEAARGTTPQPIDRQEQTA